MTTDLPPSNLTILRPAQRDYAPVQSSRHSANHKMRVRHAKLALVSALMRLDDLGVDVAGIDLNAVLEFGRKLNNL